MNAKKAGPEGSAPTKPARKSEKDTAAPLAAPNAGMTFAAKLARFNETEHGLDALETAWAKAALFFRTGERMGHGSGEQRARTLAEVHRELNARRVRFERGSTFELLHAVKLCAEENLPMPTWLANAFRAAIDGFTNIDAFVGEESVVSRGNQRPPRSLDEVFSSPNLGSTKIKAAGDRRDYGRAVKFWVRVWDRARNDVGISTLDDALKAALLGGRLGYGKTKARELFEMIDETQHQLAGTTLLSQYLAKRRNEQG